MPAPPPLPTRTAVCCSSFFGGAASLGPAACKAALPVATRGYSATTSAAAKVNNRADAAAKKPLTGYTWFVKACGAI